MSQKILHVDGDSFFVACEVARFPHLKGKPVVVGEDRGIACAMSKEAKALGIYRAYPIFKIKKEFPQVVILPSHFELYEMYSVRLYRILKKFSDTVEKYSIDECFAILDEKDMREYGSWEKYVLHIKNEVQSALGITFSFGLASTKVLSKVASSINKPNGLSVLYDHQVRGILEQLPVSFIWGIGRRLSKSLINRNIMTAEKFVEIPFKKIEEWFASPVQDIWRELRGENVLSVGGREELPKSLQATRSFTRSTEHDFVWSEFSRNVEIICSRLRSYGLVTRNVQFYLKYNDQSYSSDSQALSLATHNPRDILGELEIKFNSMFNNNRRYRATGITVFGLKSEKSVQHDLFHEQEKILSQGKLLTAIDNIREKYGTGIISLGSSFTSVKIRKKEESAHAANDPYIYGLPLPFLGEVV